MMRNMLAAALLLAPIPALAAEPAPAILAEKLQSLLFDAARSGRTDLLDAFVAQKADLNARNERGFTALILAAYNGQPAMVDALIRAGADPCLPDATQGNTALMGVAFQGHDAIARRLLATRCDVNARNAQGQTALMMAVMFDRQAQVRMLLDAGADPALADASGRTAGAIAAQQGRTAIAAMLAADTPVSTAP